MPFDWILFAIAVFCGGMAAIIAAKPTTTIMLPKLEETWWIKRSHHQAHNLTEDS